jgi:hypothetical protein
VRLEDLDLAGADVGGAQEELDRTAPPQLFEVDRGRQHVA